MRHGDPGQLERARLYVNTARHLRWQQVLARLRRTIARNGTSGLTRSGAPALDANRLSIMAAEVEGWRLWERPEAVRRARTVLRHDFQFLNHREHIEQIAWGRRYANTLWTYNLHYFDYAVDLAAAFRATKDTEFLKRFQALAMSWVTECPQGSTGWEPYPLSLRIANWTYAFLLTHEHLDAECRSAVLQSLRHQLDVLHGHVEWHLLGNHVLKNLHALVAGELLFGRRGDDGPLEGVMPVLWSQIEEQVLPDGTHFERSPMYHAIALGDCLELLALLGACGVVVPAATRDRIRRMATAYVQLSRLDGSVLLFQDSADGVAPSRGAIEILAGRALGGALPSPRPFWSLPAGRYFGFSAADSGSAIVIDGGAPSPHYQPGHAHSGMLSYTLDLRHRPVIVDSGVDGYAESPLRGYVRSTRAHNTVSIDGLDQSEMWSTFRVARRGAVRAASHAYRESNYEFRGACQHYHDQHVRHIRTITLVDAQWTITDRVTAATGRRLQSFVHLHPDFTVHLDQRRVRASHASLVVHLEFFGVDEVRVRSGDRDPDQGWYCPAFGRRMPSPTVEALVASNEGREFGYRIVAEAG